MNQFDLISSMGSKVYNSQTDAPPEGGGASLKAAERLIGDLEYGCAADFTQYRGAALSIAESYLRTASYSPARDAAVEKVVEAARLLDLRCEEEDGYDRCEPWPERAAIRTALAELEAQRG